MDALNETLFSAEALFPDVQVPCPITSRESTGKLAARSSGSYECPCPCVCSVRCHSEGLVSKMLFPLISTVLLCGQHRDCHTPVPSLSLEIESVWERESAQEQHLGMVHGVACA